VPVVYGCGNLVAIAMASTSLSGWARVSAVTQLERVQQRLAIHSVEIVSRFREFFPWPGSLLGMLGLHHQQSPNIYNTIEAL